MTKPHQATQSNQSNTGPIQLTKDDEAWLAETIPVVLATTTRHNGELGEWRKGWQLVRQVVKVYADGDATAKASLGTEKRIKSVAKWLADEGTIARRNAGRSNVEYADKEWADADQVRRDDLDDRMKTVIERLDAFGIKARRTYPSYSLSLALTDVERVLNAATTPMVLR